MLPIAHSPCVRDVALWHAGGDQVGFASALAAQESAAWTCGHTGDVDESLWTFDDREWWIARCLARQGRNVIALPPRAVAALRSPDAAVSGLPVEFKTYRGTDPRQLLRKVGEAWPQADRAVIGVGAQWDPAIVRSVFRAAIHSAIRLRMRAVMFIGDDFQFEWGDWNPCFTRWEESITGALVAAQCHQPCDACDRVPHRRSASGPDRPLRAETLKHEIGGHTVGQRRVTLDLVDLRPTGSDERRWQPPFDEAVEYEHPHWWNRQRGDDPWFVQALEGGIEVARVELDDPGGINPEYANVPVLGDERLEIQFIEVATAARGGDVGGRVVRRLMERHPNRRHFAYSVEADWFWAKLGWKPFYDPRPGPPGSPLFIQPAR